MARCYNCMKEYKTEASYCPYCGYRFDQGAEDLYYLRPGINLKNERYMIGTAISSGGFGIVYKAWDQTLDKMVAVKEYYPSSIAARVADTYEVRAYSESNIQEFEHGKQRFLTEARSVARFGEHPNIVDVYDFFEENNTVYMVMEYMDGMTLKSYIQEQGGKINPEIAVRTALSVLDALREVHKEKFIHRDINPSNIFICKSGVVKLFDFGAACFGDAEMPKILTPHYAPPEQYNTKEIQGPWTDIYAVGATLYYALTGVKPSDAMERKEKDKLVPPYKLEPSVPKDLSNAVMRAMALKRELRFKTAVQFQEALLHKRRVLDTEEELKRRRSMRFLQLGAVVLVLGAAAGGCFYVFQKKQAYAGLNPVTLEIWVKADENDTEESAEERVRSMAEDFCKEYPQITLDIKAVSWESYEEELNRAAEEKTLPDLFDSTDLDQTYFSELAVLDQVWELVPDRSNYYILEDYDALFPEKKQLPLCMQIPVIYSMSESSETNDTAAAVVRREDQLIFEQLGITAAEDNAASAESELQRFLQGKVREYDADTGDYQYLTEQIPAQFEVEIPDTDTPLLRPDHLWSVSEAAGSDEKKAAQRLLAFMLTDRAQNILGVQYMEGIPLSKSMCDVFFDVYYGDLKDAEAYLETAKAEGSQWIRENQEYMKKQDEEVK